MIIPTGFNFINMFWEAFVWKCIKGQNTFIIQNLLVTCWWKWPLQNSHISVKVQGAVQGNVWVQVCLLSIMRSLVQVVSQQVSISSTSYQELLFFSFACKTLSYKNFLLHVDEIHDSRRIKSASTSESTFAHCPGAQPHPIGFAAGFNFIKISRTGFMVKIYVCPT